MRPMTARIILVVPCYNEEHRLHTQAFVDFLRRHPDIGLQFVDDGSDDATVGILQALRSQAGEQVHVLTLAGNAGKGEAVRQGRQAALAGKPRFIGFLDADLGTPLAELTAMAQALEDNPAAHMAIGSRIPMLGRRIARRRSRYLAGRALGLLAYPILGAVLHDTQCGAKLLRVTAATAELLAGPFFSRWIFDIELLARVRDSAEAQGLRLSDVVIEVPLREWRERGGSKVRRMDYIWATLALVRIGLRYRRSRRTSE